MIKPLKLDQLTKSFDLSNYDFKTTQDLEPSDAIIGQERAVSSLDFGLHVDGTGFNLYVAGQPGIGKMSAVVAFVKQRAAKQSTPLDWCYLYNFEDPYHPTIRSLPPGKARELEKDMDNLIEQIHEKLTRVFESDDYAERQNRITRDIKTEQESIYEQFNRNAEEAGFAVKHTPMGMMLSPKKETGEPMQEKEFNELPEDKQQELVQKRRELEQDLEKVSKDIRKAERSSQEKLRELDKQIAMNVIGGMIDDLIDKYKQTEPVIDYLKQVQEDIAEHIDMFKPSQQQKMSEQSPQAQVQFQMLKEQTFKKYSVNVLVDNGKDNGVPVIVERNPSYHNLFGRIEKEIQMGGYSTDFTMIRPGSLHRANGGYLILQMEDVLKNFLSWESLKRALTSREIQIEEVGERLGFLSTKTLRPEAMPLEVKVILVGRPIYYYLLHQYDEEFAELFKVKADFDTVMNRDDAHIKAFLSFVARFCQKENLRCLARDGVVRLLEHASRLAEDQEKISTHFGALADILRESHFWADKDKSKTVKAKHVQKAIDEKIYRSSMVQEKLQKMAERETLLIDTKGSVVSQVNGLSVMDMGDYRFGKPTRITVTVGPGRDGIMDIEREVKLGGPLHSKGVLILGGYLAKKYAQNLPLTLSARLVFEQSYSGVDGDSASSAELYAMLSALSETPLAQGIAVTGSVNQKGEVQAIGGVNEKIEGFFDLCKSRGLTGDQGVIIPAANVKNLMLKTQVLDAVKKKKFKIWAVTTIDEGLEILTGKPSGERQPDGSFKKDTINAAVEKQLLLFTENWQKLNSDNKHKLN
ncbi:AAA family ATPase [candidate division KSB1 bacterium]|nr:AAA family ATPase [candidate division KSB1 bacterium]